MYREYLTARSPIRMLEKGLHGGLGAGNLGVVLAGHGVGKSSFLVGMALDSLLRDQKVLHVGLDQTVAHVRDYYDTVFEAFATESKLEDAATVHAEADRNRSIRVYASEGFHVGKLREALELEEQTGAKPAVVILDGAESLAATDVKALRELAGEQGLELWLAVAGNEEAVSGLPERLEAAADHVSVLLALEPGNGAVALRALKDHDNPDVSALHVALDPRSLLLIRN
ncbi:MAG: AAA family ATPase [Myxococcales bacterium]|nr:AAA family ATPase [Myxococcales bacterium]